MNDAVIKSFNQLIMTHKSMHRQYLEKLGLFFGQPRLLYFIKKNPGLSQNDLVELMSVSKESVSTSVKRLEKKGFINRSADPSDKRKNILRLSESGLKILDKVWKYQNETYAKLLEPLSEDEKTELHRLFTLILDNAMEREYV